MKIKNDRNKGIIFCIIAAAMWSTAGILFKQISWNPVAISGLRSLIASIVMLGYIKKPKFKFRKHYIIGILSCATSMIAFVIANKLTTAANAILLQFTSPIFVAILSAIVLKEKLRWYDMASIAAVFVGMTLFFIENISPGNFLGNIIAIGSGLALAITTISLKMESDGSSTEITFFGNMLTFLIALPFIFQSAPDRNSLVFIVIMGIFQLGIPYIFYTQSFKYISALEAILITAVEPLLSPVWVFLFSGESPGIYAMIGGTIVILAVLLRSIYISKYTLREKSETEIAS